MEKQHSLHHLKEGTGLRFRDIIEEITPENAGDKEKGIVLLGYGTDYGAVRNKGREGSDKGPETVMSYLEKMAWPNFDIPVYYGGQAEEKDRDLEDIRNALKEHAVTYMNAGHFVIVIGGDHSLSYPYYLAMEESMGAEGIGIVNIDAHFDMRKNPRPNSGTSFHEIYIHRKENNLPFKYSVIGINEFANTCDLFETAREAGADIHFVGDTDLQRAMEYMKSSDKLFLTICMDVIDSAYAPGVSALNPMGMNVFEIRDIIRRCIATGKVRGFSLAETAPMYDHNGSTSAICARLIGEFIKYWTR